MRLDFQNIGIVEDYDTKNIKLKKDLIFLKRVFIKYQFQRNENMRIHIVR
jgi:hypothetical protein